MRILFAFMTFLMMASCKVKSQSKPKSNDYLKIINATISRAKELSIYTKTTNWEQLESKIYKSVNGADNLNDLKPTFEILLNELRDHHGTIRKVSDNSILASFTDYDNTRSTESRELDLEVWKVVNKVETKFEYTLLPDKIGYLKIVGVGPNLDGQKESDRIRKAVIDLHHKNVEKWIIDLRYNGGGNVNVMLSGIAPLFDTDKVLSIKDYEENVIAIAEIKNGNFSYYGSQPFQMSSDIKIENKKIAVLTSRWTVSSGEFVAVAFKGQKNTKFFGEATGGYTTNTIWDVIDDQVILSLSTGIYCDRNEDKYIDNVKPDVEIEFRVENDIGKDRAIRVATEWLKGK